MPRELIYTAADEGMDGLRGCLCYAGASSDALSNKILLQNLLPINNYQELYKVGNPKVHGNPIGFSHYRVIAGVRDASVISRIGPAPLYANRSNFIAHHVIIEDKEKAQAGPAWAIKNFKFRDSWSPQIGRLDTQRLAMGSLEPRVCNYWKSIAGDAGWAGWLAERAKSNKITYVLYPNHLEPLVLLQEAIALLPEHQRWNITFSTFYTLGGRGPGCSLRFIPSDADAIAAPFVDKTFHDGVLNLSRSLGKAPAGDLVNLARGEKPPEIKQPPTPVGKPEPYSPRTSNPNPGFSGGMVINDPLYSKSELFVDIPSSTNSSNNSTAPGPDNTWEILKLVGGIFGLLFLLVLPVLFTGLITNSINESKMAELKDTKEADLKALRKEVDDLKTVKTLEDEKLNKLEADIKTIKANNKKMEDEVKTAKESFSAINMVEVKDRNNLEKVLKDPKLAEKNTLKMPKDVFVNLKNEKTEKESMIIKEIKITEKETLAIIIGKNIDKVLENGGLVGGYIEKLGKDAEAKYKEYGNIQKYFQAMRWIAEDKTDLVGEEYLKKTKKDLAVNLKKIKGATLVNDDAVLLPLAHLVVLNVLIKKNNNNLFLIDESRGGLDELVEALLDEKKERFFSKPEKIKEFVDTNKMTISGILEAPNLENRIVGQYTVSKDDWKIVVEDFEAHLMKEKRKDLKDAEKIFEMIKYFQSELDRFLQGKEKTK